MADEETPTALPEHADFAILARPSADQPYAAGSTWAPTGPQEYTDFATAFNPFGHQDNLSLYM